MANPNVGQTVASTWKAVVGTKPEDNVFDDYWLLDRLSKGKAFLSVNGGRTVNGAVEYAVNSTVKSYSDTETLDTTRIDVFDEFEYAWKEYAGTVVMSELERAKNQGTGGKFALLPAKLANLQSTMRKVLNEGIFSDGTGNSSKDIGGLQHIVASSPTSGTVGGINRATFSFWRNQQSAGTQSSSAFDNLRSTMRSVYNSCASGVKAKQPTYFVTTQTVYEGYESLLTANEQVTSKTPEQGDAGFKNSYLTFKGIPGGYDADCPSGLLYFLNTDNLKLAYQKGYWMKGFPSVDPANQTVEVFKVMTIANLISNNPRRLGAITAIT